MADPQTLLSAFKELFNQPNVKWEQFWSLAYNRKADCSSISIGYSLPDDKRGFPWNTLTPWNEAIDKANSIVGLDKSKVYCMIIPPQSESPMWWTKNGGLNRQQHPKFYQLVIELHGFNYEEWVE